MGEKKKITKKKSEKKKGLLVKGANSKRQESKRNEKEELNKEAPKFDSKPNLDPRVIGAITSLSLNYQEVVQPLVEQHSYHQITNTIPIIPNFIIAKPTILVIGSNNAGKTSLINYFLNDEEGYIKKFEALKSNLHNFTHLIHGLSNAYTSPNVASGNMMWQFNNLVNLSKENESVQLQLVTLNHQLLNEINFIDSPGIHKALGESNKDDLGFMRMLNALFDRVDLICFIGIPQTLKEPVGKILDELNRVSHKTIFILNKSDENKTEKDFKKLKETYKSFLKKYIKDTNLSIFQICLDKNKHSDQALQNLIQNDLNAISERINKLPTTYKINRITTIMQYAMSIFFISIIQNELHKRSKRQFSNITIKPNEFVQFGQEFMEINGSEKFFADNKDLIIKSYTTLERSKWNPYIPTKIAEMKKFLKIDIPYLLTCANEEPEVVLKYSLPGINNKENDKAPVVAAPVKRKVIKEIKIDIPQDDDNEEEDEEEENKEGNKENNNDEKKEAKTTKKKIKQIKLNQAVIDHLNQ